MLDGATEADRLLNITARPHAFSFPIQLGGVREGLALEEIVDLVHTRGCVPDALRGLALVEIDGEPVPEIFWVRVRPKPAAVVTVSIQVGSSGSGSGKKNPLATILSLAVIVGAAYLGPVIATGLGFAASGAAASIATFAVATIGNYVVNALFPASKSSSSSSSSDATTHTNYGLSGAQNSINKWGAVPVVLGRHKITPPLGAKTHTELVGDDVYLRMLVVWGYGPLKIESIKIGDTLLSSFANVEIETREGRASDAPVTLYPGTVWEDQLSKALKHSDGWMVETGHADADEMSVEIAFGSGLFAYDDDGNQTSYTVNVEVQYAPTGTANWASAGSFNITDKYVGTLRKGLSWKLPARGRYDVRLMRTTADTDSTKITDDVVWYAIRSVKNEYPIKFPKPLAVSAIRIKATDQLNGSVDNLSATVTSYVPDWNGEEWGEAATNNPASLYRHVLTGPANARARVSRQIDDDGFRAFHAFCAAKGYSYNRVIAEQTDVFSLSAEICTAGRAAPTLTNGRWSAIIDAAGKPVVQCFTPRNSWEYEIEKDYVDLPDALRVSFVDEDNDYASDERFVYNDGYDENTALNFESFELPGITNKDLVWKFGRYHLAQAKLRPETHRFKTGLEHIVCQRGDLIRVAHDVPMWGAGWARVSSLVIDDGYTTGAILDDVVTFEAGVSYAVRVRLATGGEPAYSIGNPATETNEIAFQASIPTASGPQVGDLVMVGKADRESETLLIKKITPAADGTATIEAVEAAPEIYGADTGEIPDFDPNITDTTDITRRKPPIPEIIATQSGMSALLYDGSGGYSCRILVSVRSTSGIPRAVVYKIRCRDEQAATWTEFPSASITQGTYPVTGVDQGRTYKIQVRGISEWGVLSSWSDSTTVIVVGKDAPPGRPTRLEATSGVVGRIPLKWAAPSDLDIDHYDIEEADNPQMVGGSILPHHPTDTSYERVGLATMTTRYYRVRAVDKVGNIGEWNATVGTGAKTGMVEVADIGPSIWQQFERYLVKAIPIIDLTTTTYALIAQAEKSWAETRSDRKTTSDLFATIDGRIATITTDIRQLVDADGALAEQLTTLRAGVTENQAAVQVKLKALSDASQTLAQQIATVGVRVGAAEAAAQQETSARINADGALAQQIATVGSQTDSALALVQTKLSALTTADAAQVQSTSALVARVGAAEAAHAWEVEARSTADDALATRIDQTSATFGTNLAAAETRITNWATANFAASSYVQTVQSTVGNLTSSVQLLMAAKNGTEAQTFLGVGVNGETYGMDVYGGAKGNAIVFRADNLIISMPGYGDAVPFAATTVNGVPKVAITASAIGDAIIDTAAIRDLSVNGKKIEDLACTNIGWASGSGSVSVGMTCTGKPVVAQIIEETVAYGFVDMMPVGMGTSITTVTRSRIQNMTSSPGWNTFTFSVGSNATVLCIEHRK